MGDQGAIGKVSGKPKRNDTYARVKIQPPLLVLIHVALAYILAWFVPLPLPVPPIIQITGFLLLILGFLLGLGALIAFKRARTTYNSHRLTAPLVTFGVYRFTRNPVYLGFLLILIGILLNSASYWGILLAPVLITLFNRLVIEPEEENLAQKFGDEYGSYKAKVRRWL